MEQQLLESLDSGDDNAITNALFDMIQEYINGAQYPMLVYDSVTKLMTTGEGPKNHLVRQLVYDVLSIASNEGNEKAPKAILGGLRSDLVVAVNPDITLSALKAITSLPYNYQFEFLRTLKPDFLKKPLIHENPCIREQAIRTYLSLVLRIYPTLSTPPLPSSFESEADRIGAMTDCRDHCNDIMRAAMDLRSDKDDKVLVELFTQLSQFYSEYYHHNLVAMDEEINQLESADDYEKKTTGGDALRPLLLLLVRMFLPQLKIIGNTARLSSLSSAGAAALFGSQMLGFALTELQSTGLLYDCELSLEHTTTPTVDTIKDITLNWGNNILLPLFSSHNYETIFSAAKGMTCLLGSPLIPCPIQWASTCFYGVMPMTQNINYFAHPDLARVIVSCSRFLPPFIYTPRPTGRTFYEQTLMCLLRVEDTTERLRLLHDLHHNYIQRCVLVKNQDNSGNIPFLLKGSYIDQLFKDDDKNTFREEVASTILMPLVDPPRPITQSWVKVASPILSTLIPCLYWEGEAPAARVFVEAINNISVEVHKTTDETMIKNFEQLWPLIVSALPKISLPIVINVLFVLSQYVSEDSFAQAILDRIHNVFDDISDDTIDEQVMMLLRAIRIFGMRMTSYAPSLVALLKVVSIKESLSMYIKEEVRQTIDILGVKKSKKSMKSIIESYQNPVSIHMDRDFGVVISDPARLDYRVKWEIGLQKSEAVGVKKTTRETLNIETDNLIQITSSTDPIYITARKRLCPQNRTILLEYTLINMTNATFNGLKLALAISGPVHPPKPIILHTPFYSQDKITVPYALQITAINTFQCMLYLTLTKAEEVVKDSKGAYLSGGGDFSLRTTPITVDRNDLLWAPEDVPGLVLYRMIWNSLPESYTTVLSLPPDTESIDFGAPWKRIDTPLNILSDLSMQAAAVNTLFGIPVYGSLYPLPDHKYWFTMKVSEASFISQFKENEEAFLAAWFGEGVTKSSEPADLNAFEPQQGKDGRSQQAYHRPSPPPDSRFPSDCLAQWKELRKRRDASASAPPS